VAYPRRYARFKELTANHPIIMGRKTFESILTILGKPLPGRQNIVVTRNAGYEHPGVMVFSSFEDALTEAQKLDQEEIHIGGGAEIYTQALPVVDKLHLTLVDDEPEGDTFFPAFENDFEVVTEHEKREHRGLAYQWIDYIRKK
jgi:dihydrofolate reductase